MRQFATLEDILGVLRRRFALILAVIFLGVVVSVVIALNQIRVFEATAVIQIELPEITEDVASTTTGPRAKYRLQLIEQQLMARDSLTTLIGDLGLFAEATQMTDVQKVVALRESVSISQIISAADTWRPDAVPSGLYISVRMSNPVQAAETANAFVARILAQAETRREAQASEALAFFEGEEARVEAKILAQEARIADFKRSSAASLPIGIASLQTQLVTLRQTELEIDGQIINLRTSTQRIREETLQQQIAELENQKVLVTARITDLELALAAAPQVERELNALSRELEQLKDQFTVITTRKAEAEMGQMLESSHQAERFEILETALVPVTPVSASRKRTVLLGTIIATMLAAGLAVLLEVLNPVVRTPAQLEQELGITAVVAIPTLGRSRKRSGWRRHRRKLIAGLAAIIAVMLALLPVLQRAMQSLRAYLRQTVQTTIGNANS